MQTARDITDQHLRSALEPLIHAEGFQCVELQLQRSRRTRHLRVIVYRGHGMDAAALEQLTRAIQFELGVVVDPAGANLSDLSLEVSSPGIERTLRGPHEYAIFAGKAVRVLRVDSETWEQAVIQASTETEVTLQFDEELETIPIAKIRRGQLTGAEKEGS